MSLLNCYQKLKIKLNLFENCGTGSLKYTRVCAALGPDGPALNVILYVNPNDSVDKRYSAALADSVDQLRKLTNAPCWQA